MSWTSEDQITAKESRKKQSILRWLQELQVEFKNRQIVGMAQEVTGTRSMFRCGTMTLRAVGNHEGVLHWGVTEASTESQCPCTEGTSPVTWFNFPFCIKSPTEGKRSSSPDSLSARSLWVVALSHPFFTHSKLWSSTTNDIWRHMITTYTLLAPGSQYGDPSFHSLHLEPDPDPDPIWILPRSPLHFINLFFRTWHHADLLSKSHLMEVPPSTSDQGRGNIPQWGVPLFHGDLSLTEIHRRKRIPRKSRTFALQSTSVPKNTLLSMQNFKGKRVFCLFARNIWML